VRYDIGRASTDQPPILPADWPTRFQPPGGSMQVSSSGHNWFAEVGLGVEPKWPVGKGEIGVPVSYNLLGLSSREKRFYSIRRPLATTQLDWRETVRLQAITLERVSPLMGISYTRWRVSFRPAFQIYRLVAEDYTGKNGTSSRLHSIRSLETGFGQRYEVQFRADPEEVIGIHFAPWNFGAIGVFYERQGARGWQLGISLTSSMALSVRR
jgi:hypothetical protein